MLFASKGDECYRKRTRRGTKQKFFILKSQFNLVGRRIDRMRSKGEKEQDFHFFFPVFKKYGSILFFVGILFFLLRYS